MPVSLPLLAYYGDAAEKHLPVHTGIPIVCNAICSLAQVPCHREAALKARQSKPFQHYLCAICIIYLPIAGCQSACSVQLVESGSATATATAQLGETSPMVANTMFTTLQARPSLVQNQTTGSTVKSRRV